MTAMILKETSSLIDTMTTPPPIEETQTLTSINLRWQETSLLGFLRVFADSSRIYWQNNRLDYGFAGAGAAAILRAEGDDRFAEIRRQSKYLFDGDMMLSNDAPEFIRPRLFGGFRFTSAEDNTPIWSAFPAALFILPQYQLTQINGEMWLTINVLQSASDEAEHLRVLEGLVYDLHHRIDNYHQVETNTNIFESDYQMDFPAWESIIKQGQTQIKQGKIDKVVLARACKLTGESEIDPISALSRLEQAYPNCYRFLIEPEPGQAFYGATPEILADVAQKTLKTVALAGSTRRGKTAAEDDQLAADFLNNPKERHEQQLVIRSIRKRLNTLTETLEIPETPELHKLQNIQHLSTPITGRLNPERSILEVVEALHPTPAVGGTPRDEAVKLIGELEPLTRGWYAAPVGWMDASGDGLFAVAIRSAVSKSKEAYLYSGAGIVPNSTPKKEWDETELKLRPMLGAIRGEGNEAQS